MKMKMLVSIISTCIITVALAATYISQEDQLSAEQCKLIHIGGTLRNSSDGWNYISDGSHMTLGFNTDIAPYVNNNGQLILKMKKWHKKIITIVVGPDESFARSGTSAGASVSRHGMAINFGKNGYFIDANNVSSSGNIWINGMMCE